MKRVVIGVIGAPHSGVTLVSKRLAQAFGFQRVRFGDAMTRMLVMGLGLTVDQIDGPERKTAIPELGGCSGNFLKQSLGVDWGRRTVHTDLWIAPWRKMIAASVKSIVTDDLRFPNEAAAIRDAGGLIWRVHRPGHDGTDANSDRMRKLVTADVVLLNESPEGLLDRVDACFQELLAKMQMRAT